MAAKNLSKEDSQKMVLTLLEQGQTIKMAMEAVNRSESAYRQWTFTDPTFKEDAEKARLVGEGIKVDLADLKNISFEDFSAQFLESQLFDHHKSWIDLVEGNEPRWVHPAMTYEPGAKNRVLINVPPEHAKSTVLTINYVTYRLAIEPNVRIIIVSIFPRIFCQIG